MTRVSQGEIGKRTWTYCDEHRSTSCARKLGCTKGRKRTAFYFDVTVNGKRKREQYPTRPEAETALDAFRDEQRNPKPIEPPVETPRESLTLGEAFTRYFATKVRKRSLEQDRLVSKHLLAAFGANTPLADLTANRISAYKAERLATKSRQTGQLLSSAAVNRPLALLRHVLRLAHEEWEVLDAAPRIRLEREPQGRIKWLEDDAEQRLLDACRASRTKALTAIVTVALESGLRKAEVLGLSWDRVDLSRGVIRLELTKSGRRREVPMRQAVYDLLAGMPGAREGRVWHARNIRQAFENAVTKAKLDDFHFHDCRHHFASWFVMRGGSLPALKEILGHATLAMTMRYAHLAPGHLRSEVMRTERRAGVVADAMPADVTTASHELRAERV
jgi:integrase